MASFPQQNPHSRQLLSDGLNLCVRARNMDAMDRRAAALACSVDPEAWQADGTFDRYVEGHNAMPEFAHQPISTRSGTVALWLQDQYDRDLTEWETKSRKHLMQGCENGQT